MSPSPTICKVAPAIKVYAVLFRLELNFPVIMDPIDEQKSRGSSFSPAIIGVLWSTIWNRCGRLMATMKKVNPENSVDLRHGVNEISTGKEYVLQDSPTNDRMQSDLDRKYALDNGSTFMLHQVPLPADESYEADGD